MNLRTRSTKDHNQQLHMRCAANSARTPAPKLTAQGKQTVLQPTLFMLPKPMRLMAPRLRAGSGGEKRRPSAALSTPRGTVTTAASARKQWLSVWTSTPAGGPVTRAGQKAGGRAPVLFEASGLRAPAAQQAMAHSTNWMHNRAHLLHSAAPPAPGCRRRWAALGTAPAPSARCSLHGWYPGAESSCGF